MESFVRVTPMPIKRGEMVFLCNCSDAYKNYGCVHSGVFSMLWNLEMTFPDVERAHHLKAKQTKKGLNPFDAVAKRNKRRRSPSHQHRTIPKSYGNPCCRPTMLLWKTVVPVWRQRVAAWNVLRFRHKCISCKPLHMPHLIRFFCTHRRNPVLSLLLLSLQDARSRIATGRRRILCSRMWISSVLFPREARVLLDIVTSRRTFRRGGGYICIMLHVRCVNCLTGWTHLHSVQKPSASQTLPLEMEKTGGKRACSASPTAYPSTQQTRSTQKL
jgi:hypothetical protein